MKTRAGHAPRAAAKPITHNLDHGAWAVAVVGTVGWRRQVAIGDGITSALNALVGRYATSAEAEAEAARLEAAYGGEPLPGQPDCPVFDARKYDIKDYLSDQDRRNGDRPVDRSISRYA